MTDPAPQPAAAPGAPLSASDDKLWASLAHFGGLLYILPSLIIYLVLKDRGERTRVEAKEALNWQITFLIIWVVWIIIASILTIPFLLAGISFLIGLIGFLIWAVNAVFSILGGVKVQQGGSYRYPFAFRWVK
ncbi:MAG: uncharacterized protein QOF79_3040 [Actinomycetota bacterium]|jgi:uncharacterized Tic20 family protein|nr:uncharacterized protein [Actinomycetota bacterium]